MTVFLPFRSFVAAVLTLAAVGALSGCSGKDSGLSSYVGRQVHIITKDSVWRPGIYANGQVWQSDKRIIGEIISADGGGVVVRTTQGNVWIARDQLVSLRDADA